MSGLASPPRGPAAHPLDVGSRRQLFVDRQAIDRLDGLDLRLHPPVRMPRPDRPLAGSYMTVIRDGPLYRAYWRDDSLTHNAQDAQGNADRVEYCRYAESRDGQDWHTPSLGLHAVNGSANNNVVLCGGWGKAHNFCPFLDTRPGVPAAERYKALSTGQEVHGATITVGLRAFTSPDGIHWAEAQDRVRARRGGPPRTGLVIERGPDLPAWDAWLDSQNVAFWSDAEHCYVCYFRTRVRQPGQPKPLRAISRATAVDFLGEWSAPALMEANLPGENLYTSQTHPYVRAPDVYLAFPTRFLPDRGASTDILFMTARPGATRYDRLFTEAFIRPGLDPERWGNRANYLALNAVPTGPAELSLYHRSGHRYTLRADGFVSLHAGAAGGVCLTPPLVFRGRALRLNYSTSAAGGLRIGILRADGTPIPCFRLDAAPALVGDAIDQAAAWAPGADLAALAGQPVRLQFALQDADLYAFRFATE